MRLNDRIAEGLAALDEAEPLATAAALPLELSRLHHLRGNLLFPLGRDADCVREHELALAPRARGRIACRRRRRPSAGSATATTCKAACARRNRAVPRVRRARPRARLRPARGRQPVDDRLVGHAPGRDRRVRSPSADEAIELAMRASQPRAELMARTARRLGRGPDPRPRDEAEPQASSAALALARDARRAALRGADPRRATPCSRCARGDRERAPAARRRGARASAASTAWAISGPGSTASARWSRADREARARLARGRRATARARLRQPQPRRAARAGDRRAARARRQRRRRARMRADPRLHRRRSLADERVRGRARTRAGPLRRAASAAPTLLRRLAATCGPSARGAGAERLPARARRRDRDPRQAAARRRRERRPAAARADDGAGRAAHRPRHQRGARLALFRRPALRRPRRSGDGRPRALDRQRGDARRDRARAGARQPGQRAGPTARPPVRDGWQRWATMVDAEPPPSPLGTALHRRRRPEVHRPRRHRARRRPAQRGPRRAAPGPSRQHAGGWRSRPSSAGALESTG